MISLAEAKHFGKLADDIAFSGSIFMLFGLPTRKLPRHLDYWVKKNKYYKLIIQSGPDQKRQIPYGCYARMNQIFIDTEVVKKQTNIIDLGRSFTDYTKKLGYTDGKANRAILNQLLNYVTARVVVKPATPEAGRTMGVQTLIAKGECVV